MALKLKDLGILLESPIPDDWDIKSNAKFEDILSYAKNKAEQIGEGSSRVAFIIDYDNRPTVLKIAKNDIGVSQNLAELKISGRKFNCIIPFIDGDYKNNNWVHTEYANAIKINNLKDFFGVNILSIFSKISKSYTMENAIDDYKIMLEYHKIKTPNNMNLILNYFEEINELVYEYDISSGDLQYIHNWGMYKNTPVIIDIGLNDYIYYFHYTGEN